MSQIGSNIKKLRKVKGLSQAGFAELFNLTRGNISSYEEFRAEPKIEVVLQIAKYFGIPVAELLQEQLTVNEILNFEDHFEAANTIKPNGLFTSIPFLGREAFHQTGNMHVDLAALPQLQFPTYSIHKLLAVENDSYLPRPAAFPFEEQGILFFEEVALDILHSLDKHIGFYLDGGQSFFGVYEVEGKRINLILNDWKHVSFEADAAGKFWVLYGQFSRRI